MKKQSIANCKGSMLKRRRGHKNLLSVSRMLGGIFAVILVLACSFGFGSFFSSAHGNEQPLNVDYKYYKSIEIQKGDSLWSIAETYMNDKYDSVHEYIDELVSINNMNANKIDAIQEGDYLMVAYYDNEYK